MYEVKNRHCVLCTSKYSEGSNKGREGKREGGRTRTDLVALLLLRVPHTGLIALLVPGMHSDEEGGRRIRGGGEWSVRKKCLGPRLFHTVLGSSLCPQSPTCPSFHIAVTRQRPLLSPLRRPPPRLFPSLLPFLLPSSPRTSSR